MKEREFVYIPQDKLNIDSNNPDKFRLNFTGLPCPRKEVVELIGVDGVTAIDEKIKEMIRWKMLLYGKNSNKVKFPSSIDFFDRNDSNVCVHCSPLIVLPEMEDFEKIKDKFYYRDRADSRTGSYNLELNKYSTSIQDKISKILQDGI